MNKESYTLLDNQIWEDENLSHTEFRVLSYLIRTYSLEYGYSFPLREQITEKCKMHKDTLNKVLKGLQDKGYITIGKHKTKTGWNNIYYIHKYLVASKKDKVEPKPQEAPSNKKQVEASTSTNELLVNEKAKVKRKLNDNDKEYLNGLNTDILIKAIERANEFKPNGYHIGYIASCYESIEKELQEERKQATEPKTSKYSSNNKKDDTEAKGKDYYNNNYPVKTKYHDSFNEHFRNYTEDELEAKLLKAQNKLRGLA